jgi:hypothetical protein
VARDDGDARRVLAAKLSAWSSWATTSTGDPGPERGDHREAQRRGERGGDQPAVHRQAIHPAPLEVEPDDLDDDADRPEQADVALAVAERRQVERIEGVQARVREDRSGRRRRRTRRRPARAAPTSRRSRPTAACGGSVDGGKAPRREEQQREQAEHESGKRSTPAAWSTKPLAVTAPTKPTDPHMRTRP